MPNPVPQRAENPRHLDSRVTIVERALLARAEDLENLASSARGASAATGEEIRVKRQPDPRDGERDSRRVPQARRRTPLLVSAETLLAYRMTVRIDSHARLARFAMTRLEADALREAGYGVTGNPDFAVFDRNALDAADIEIRPQTIDRMRLAELHRRTADTMRTGKVILHG
jgi:hypothetical protein